LRITYRQQFSASSQRIQRAKEGRAVGGAKSGIVALDFSSLAKMLFEVTHGEGHADGSGREWLAGKPQNVTALVDSAARQRDIGGEHDVICCRLLDDPVIS